MEDNIEKLYFSYKKILIFIAIILFHFGFFYKESKKVISGNKMKNLSLIKNKSETIKQKNTNSEINQLINNVVQHQNN